MTAWGYEFEADDPLEEPLGIRDDFADPREDVNETDPLIQENERLRKALNDLIDAACSRVPGDEALWSARIDDARAALERKP